MGSTADWWYKERLPELQREEEEKAKLKKEKEGIVKATQNAFLKGVNREVKIK